MLPAIVLLHLLQNFVCLRLFNRESLSLLFLDNLEASNILFGRFQFLVDHEVIEKVSGLFAPVFSLQKPVQLYRVVALGPFFCVIKLN